MFPATLSVREIQGRSRDWNAALNRFTIQFDERILLSLSKPRLHKILDTAFAARIEDDERVGIGAGQKHRTGAQAGRIVPIDEDVVVEVAALAVLA